MFKYLFLMFVVVSAQSFCSEKSQTDWVKLFNETSFEGWQEYGGKHEFKVVEGMIVGTAVAKEPNGFLTTKATYKDFELKFEVKVDYSLNSGCQIRSVPYGPIGHLKGPQVEISSAKSGFIYGEHMTKEDGKTRMGWLSPDIDSEKVEPKKSAFKHDQWNSFRILVKGGHYQTFVNGIKMTDFHFDKMMEAAHIGLQVHRSKGKVVGKSVRWKNLFIRSL